MSGTTDVAGDTAERAKRFAEALQALDADVDAIEPMVELFSERAELTNAATALTGDSFGGRGGARTFWEEYRAQFEEATTEFHHVTAGEDGSAGLFWNTRGKTADGESLDYAGATLLVFDEEGLVERFHGYYDTRQLVVSDLAGS